MLHGLHGLGVLQPVLLYELITGLSCTTQRTLHVAFFSYLP